MGGELVLIIDDSAELRSVLETILPYGGYEVIVAGTGSEGLALVQEKHPDLIMVDLELPDTNGLKILERLKEQGLSTPTIMMTGYGSEGVAARALRLGVRDYLIKPFTTEEVLSSVERALIEVRLRREKEHLTALLTGCSRHLKLVSAVGRSIAAGLAPGEAFERIVGSAMYVTRAEAAFLIVQDEGTKSFRMVGVEGKARQVSGPVSAAAGDNRLRSVLQQGVAVVVNSTDSPSIELQTGEWVQAVLQVPLGGAGNTSGLLSVDRRNRCAAFNEYDKQFLMILADYAAMILDRQRQLV